jgi:pimeloyl-ACP methyl ester carboxylesterase
VPIATVDGHRLGFTLTGPATGQPWVITPGARAGRDEPGVAELAQALADRGHRVLTWDRPNTGESDVRFDGASESEMQADALAGLLHHLELAPAVIAGGSGGSRVSLLTAVRHPDVASAVAMWWITGGVTGLLGLAMHYCNPSVRAAWHGGMTAVADLPDWAEVQRRSPANRDRILGQDRAEFIATMERWMLAYCPCGSDLVPGLSVQQAASFDRPVLVFRSGTTDAAHRRETSEQIADALPSARLVEPPWGDDEWNERQAARNSGDAAGLFVRWTLLAPQLDEWARSLR